MPRPAVPVALSLLLLPYLAQAQGPATAPPPPKPEGEDSSRAAKVLPPLIVTATREGEEWLTSPNTVEQLAAEQLAERLVRNLPEALRELPGVHVQKTANGQGSPYIRGFTGFRTLALIDGVRFNNS